MSSPLLSTPERADHGGIRIDSPDAASAALALQHAGQFVRALDLAAWVSVTPQDGAPGVSIQAMPAFAARYLPDGDTTGLAEALKLRTDTVEADLDREIVLAMLACPVAFVFPDVAELESAVRIKRYTVQAASKTALAFDTEQAERPADYWTYDEARGFTILPGQSLIEGLRRATQPEASGELYSFSCYRATEYVTVLGIAQELETANPEMARRLQRQWETRAVMSGRFHDADRKSVV